jgi:D-glycero-alpha-D-manno-heptose 1-phosphate guanylyltransferase
MEAIILAGGLGTRLASRLSGVPKPMAPIAGRPFLEILLNQLKEAGCTRVLLSVGHLHAVIRDHFGQSYGGMRIDYAVEETPLGTGGAIRNALALAREDAVLVLNGDTFLEADYAAMMRFHRSEDAGMTMAVAWQDDVARYGGVVVSDRRVVGFQEKGRAGAGQSHAGQSHAGQSHAGWINAGSYVLNRDFEWPAELEGRFSFEKEVLALRVSELRPAAFIVSGYFLDIGVPEDFDRAQTELVRF